MAEPKKLTTEEILALARKQKAGGTPSGGADESASPPAESPPAESASSPPSAEEAASSEPAAPAPKAAPKSTADILAAARAQGSPGKSPAESPAGGESSKSPASAPKSTADILAAARAQGGSAKPAAKPAGGAAPKSTADILAAARAQGKGAAPAAPAQKPAAAAKPTAKPTAAPAGEHPPLKDMVAVVKAAQEGKPVTPAQPAGAKAKPRLPGKAEPYTRRAVFPVVLGFLLSPFILAWVACGAIGGLLSLGIARFMMPNMILELPSKFKVGPPSDFPPGTVSEKYKASRGIWVVHSDEYDGRDMIYALLSICTHLGCTPNWLEGEQKFKCPCHGSGYYITGVNFEGPAPRPLERVGVTRAPDGMIEIDKSMKFQEELGQWGDSKSFLLLS